MKAKVSYNQLRDGDKAGLDAYREVPQEIIAGGYAAGKLGERVDGKIGEIVRNRTAKSAKAEPLFLGPRAARCRFDTDRPAGWGGRLRDFEPSSL